MLAGPGARGKFELDQKLFNTQKCNGRDRKEVAGQWVVVIIPNL